MRDGHGTNISGIAGSFPTGLEGAWQPFFLDGKGGREWVYMCIAKNLLNFFKC